MASDAVKRKEPPSGATLHMGMKSVCTDGEASVDSMLAASLGSKIPVALLRSQLAEFMSSKAANPSAGADIALPKYLDLIYGAGSAESALRAASTITCACDMFVETHGECSVEVMRSPARVNLRGMHIDNNGGYTNTICVDREIFIVFTLAPRGEGPLIQLHNTNDEMSPRQVTISPSVTEEDVKQALGWGKYVAGAVLATKQMIEIDKWPLGIRGVVASSCPAGVGLSSSHAFVLCVLNALFQAACLKERPDPLLELKTAQRSEHLCGIKSGLTDQGSMIFGQRGEVLHGRFYDLKIQEIPSTVKMANWPTEWAIVVANSRVVRPLASKENAILYALPRLGCAIALPVMRTEAASRGLSADDTASWGLEETLSMLKLVPDAATFCDLLKLFPDRHDEIEAAVERLIPGGKESLGDVRIPLRGSTLFVLAESARAKDFLAGLQSRDLNQCGDLMDIGHEGDDLEADLCISDADLDGFSRKYVGKGLGYIPGVFRAGHPRLDELCKELRTAGAKGACLTGAGRGGCVIGLFASNASAKAGVSALLKAFSDLTEQDVFVSAPIQGRGFLQFS